MAGSVNRLHEDVPEDSAIRADEQVMPDDGGNGPAVTEIAASPKLERRSRKRRLGRPLLPDPPHYNDRHLFPAKWPYLIAVVLLSIVGASYVAGELPGAVEMAHFALALVALIGANTFQPLVHQRQFLGKLIGLGAFVVVPLAIYANAMILWAYSGALGWDVVFASLLTVTAIVGVYLRRHPGVTFAGQLALWIPVLLSHGSLAAAAGVFLALMVAVLVSIEQFRADRKQDRERETRDRLQMRASEILADYEETQQGWFWETDRRGLLTYVSAPIAKLMGKTSEELFGQPFTQLFDLPATGDEGERQLEFNLSSRSAFIELPMRAAVAERELWWAISGRAYFDNFDNFIGFRGSGTDLTERRRSEQHTSRLAAFDSLTGLANRYQMSRALEDILEARQETNRVCTIMLLDLDRFKRVNDTMGHPAGDALLKQVARRLESAVGKLGKVGRLGGDEFQVIIPSVVSREAVGELADKIIKSLSQPYAIEGKRVLIGASIGLSTAPEDGKTSEVLIRNADLALYAAKDGGRGRYQFFADDLHADAQERTEIASDLRKAIARDELSLQYQPVVDTITETISGFEALLRWHHPERGRIEPATFISIAEDSGLIMQIGEWALRQACSDLASWPEAVRVSVNVSAMQFANAQFPEMVADALSEAGIDPSRLELEITESVFLSDDEGVEAMFAELKRIGVRLALDDFGTGYSSLGYLERAPFDKIKIDRSFIRGLNDPGSRNGAIIASITGLAHTLGMETIAEGVETLDELDLVRMFGCSHVQGFIYERPLTAEGARMRLQSGLAVIARGPRQTRLPRQVYHRQISLLHKGQRYHAAICNISLSGALVEGLWNVPEGTRFELELSAGQTIGCVTRWCAENRIGIEFDTILERNEYGRITALDLVSADQTEGGSLRRAG